MGRLDNENYLKNNFSLNYYCFTVCFDYQASGGLLERNFMEYLLGVVVAMIVEAAKKYLDSNVLGTYFILLVVSVAGATGYYFLAHSGYWSTIAEILTIAAAFHNLVIRRLNPEK